MTYDEWKAGRIQLLKLSNEEAHQFAIECLEESLVDLMEEKKFSDITVTDIVKRAGISRTSFYKNFKTKEDVLIDITDRKCREMSSQLELSKRKTSGDQYSIWIRMFEVVKDNGRFLGSMLRSGMGDMLLDFANDYAIDISEDRSVRNQYANVYVSGAVYSLSRHWILTGMKEAPEEMAKILLQL